MTTFDSIHEIQTSLVIAKTKVSPIKRLYIPRLELFGAVILAQLMNYVGEVLNIWAALGKGTLWRKIKEV